MATAELECLLDDARNRSGRPWSRPGPAAFGMREWRISAVYHFQFPDQHGLPERLPTR